MRRTRLEWDRSMCHPQALATCLTKDLWMRRIAGTVALTAICIALLRPLALSMKRQMSEKHATGNYQLSCGISLLQGRRAQVRPFQAY